MYLLQPLSYARTTGKLLLLSLLFTLGARESFAQFGGGAGTQSNPYLISTAQHLRSLSLRSVDWSKHFRQTANINLNGVSIETMNLSGVYDGNNFTISNYTITGTSDDRGLFSELSSSATVQDLTLHNFDISGGLRVGALAGKATGGSTISNVDVTSVTIDGNFDSGGIVGECGGCTIENSSVDAMSSIDCGNSGGGIVGKSVGSSTYTNLSGNAQMSGSSLGGIVGAIFQNSASFTDCTSQATINGSDRLGGIAGKCTDTPSFNNCSFSGSISGTWHCGGIIGRVEGGTATITNCNNSGSITQTSDEGGGIIGTTDGTANISTSYNTGSINANWKSAGIIGRVNSNSTVTITECYNSGTITSNGNQAGGIVGTSTGVSDITKSYNTGSITSNANSGGIIGRVESPPSGHSSLTDCYNTGAIDGGWSAGIIGEETNGGATTVVHCYNAGTVDNDSSVGDLVSKGGSATVTATACFYDEDVNTAFTSQTITGITGKTTTEMKTGSTFADAGWDDTVWFIDANTNNGYPNLDDIGFGVGVVVPYNNNAGSGTELDPHQIASIEDLIYLSQTPGDWGLHFRQVADLTFDATEGNVDWNGDGTVDAGDNAGFSPIGNSTTPFTGSYDGNEKTISNLFIDQGTSNTVVGLFGETQLSGVGLSDLGLLSVDITGFTAGALVGRLSSAATAGVSGCYSTGSVTGADFTGAVVGGLVGEAGNNNSAGTIMIENCYSRCSVNNDGSGVTAGGLVGKLNAAYTISKCYSTGNVTSSGLHTGGLVGVNPSDAGTVNNSFWNEDTSGQNSSAGGTGKSTTEMTTASTFGNANWDGTVWTIDANTNDGYPNLQGIGPGVDFMPYDGNGSGTLQDPYQIDSVEDLIYLSQTTGDWGKHFIQVADIDFGADETAVDWDNDGNPDGMNTAGFSPIGNSTTPFTGSYDGDGKTISNLFINQGTSNTVGLFGETQLSGVGLSDLGLLSVDITGSTAGALVGRLSSTATAGVSGCYSTGSVTGGTVGGLVGQAGNDTSAGTIMIENCYSRCSVAVNIGGATAGGLVGRLNAAYTISNCYSTGNVNSTDIDAGGLVGRNLGTINNSFWDTHTSGQATSAGGTGKNTTEMTTASTFTAAPAEWSTPWYIDATENNGYPNLSGVGLPLASFSTDLTIVSNGGGTQDTDWAVNGGMLYGLSGGAVSVNASDLNNQLSTGDLELSGNSLTVNENIAPGSGTHTLTLGFSNGVTVPAGKGIDLGGSLVNNSSLTLTSTSTSYSSLKVLVVCQVLIYGLSGSEF